MLRGATLGDTDTTSLLYQGCCITYPLPILQAEMKRLAGGASHGSTLA